MDLNGVTLTFEPPLRFSNHSGGVTCLSASNRLRWLMLPGDYMTAWCDLNNGLSPSVLMGLREISFSMHQNIESLDDPFAEVFLNIPGRGGKCLDYEQMERWSGLAVAYRNRKNPKRALRAERISKQIRFCCNALDELFKAYRFCLTSDVAPEKISHLEDETFSYFSNKTSLLIGYKVQPCLDALFSLRDFLTTFIFEEMHGLDKEPNKGLYRKFFANCDTFNLARLIIPAFSQTEPLGIIARFSTYRNVFFHYVGIASSGPAFTCYCYRHAESTLGNLPFMIYPLDDDYDRLRLIETGNFLDPLDREAAQEEAKRFMSLPAHIDALDLCFDGLRCLLQIAEAAELAIDLPSEAIKITADEIIKATFVSDGQERRYERDEEGNLREV